LRTLYQIRISSWGSGAIERLLDAVLDGILSIMHNDPGNDCLASLLDLGCIMRCWVVPRDIHLLAHCKFAR
jgi:hypothetical protein